LAARLPGASLIGQSAISKASRSHGPRRFACREHFYLLLEINFMTKLYVGNLPFTITEDTLRNLFAPHGTVEKISLISDRDTGRPRGFGFVEMSNADASRAMQALNGQDLGGRPLKINEAQDKPRGGGGAYPRH
jgi:RNA recognition motif-containing protein